MWTYCGVNVDLMWGYYEENPKQVRSKYGLGIQVKALA